jgi:two-component system response regulator AtoC
MEFEKPGLSEPLPLKARIIASTNKNLEQLIAEGRFREELYYRLKVFTIELPPLRKRKDDINDLTYFFIQRFNRKLQKNISQVGEGVFEKLKSYNWPGNIRELENSILQAMIIVRGNVLEKDSFSIPQNPTENEVESLSISALTTLDEVEKTYIKQVLYHVKWNKVDASRILGISRPTLNAKIEKYEIRQN